MLVRFADEIPVGNMKPVLKFAIDLKIATSCVFEENHCGAVVHDRSKPFFTLAQGILRPLPFGDIQEHRPPVGDAPCSS